MGDLFSYESIIIKNLYEQEGNEINYASVMIMKKDGKTNLPVPHAFTEFIQDKGEKNSYNAQKAMAANVVPFLNYIVDNKEDYSITNFKDLTFDMGSDFLNLKASAGLKKKTVKTYNNYLTRFYYYLATKNYFNKIKSNEFVVYKYLKDGIPQEKIESPFKVHYSNAEDEAENLCMETLHNMPIDLVFVFLDVAKKYHPEILLGVYYNFFGGLRCGEVVNLAKSDVTRIGPYGKDGFILNIMDRRFRPDIKNPEDAGEVKRPRIQRIFAVGELGSDIFKAHLDYIKKHNKNCLFYNKNGDAMTAKTYRTKFNDTRDKFLKLLMDSEVLELRNAAERLMTFDWSTHIGRGFYSNLLASYCENIVEVAVLRGDRDYNSSEVYMADTDEVAKRMRIVLTELYTKR